ncbi:unnamed protein product [Urochloa decumbens]|uniref:Alginate lyase 2 domain-containing protein n=1 Tax=Urochloa decumbens TaxID=240449 RepID=A0ABC9AYB5_9POAL
MAASSTSSSHLLLLAAAIICALSPSLPCAAAKSGRSPSAHLTAGYEQFGVQKPYDVPLRERYEQSDGVRRMWVFASDKPISSSRPATPAPRSKSTVSTHASTMMLHVYGGRLTYYHELDKVVAARVYDRWVRLNVVHDVAAGNVTVFVDGERRLSAAGHGVRKQEHYFKFGVYKQSRHQPSRRMESRWKNVAVYTKP